MIKLKNKLIGLIISLIIIGVGSTQVMAASIGADKTEVKKGEEVKVTVSLTEKTQALDLVLTYDASKFEYVKGSVTSSIGDITVNDTVEGKVNISAASASKSTDSITYTFIAKETTDATEFKASGLVTESSEELTVDTVSVKVVEEEQQPEPEQPDQPQQPDLNEPVEDNNTQNNDNKEQTNNEDKKVDENGKEITKLPQTGVSIINVLAVLTIAGVAIVGIRKLIIK